ncbi:hypothetical protein [Aliidiomarina sanyensis]|uniref:Uncharacterized protein n=1 Tax=Aliidiomarina sanyensis TaxID=1249555 RepID=A0A432WNH1_9GAMM|nr:hypothetical protein [Aliidiomarina sanyensis]RUO35325.1 hypothetical protein CWE11_04740 [Aliidiomarina sanyensis]
MIKYHHLSAAMLAVFVFSGAHGSESERVIVGFQPGAKAEVLRFVERQGGRAVVDLSRESAMALEVPPQALRGLRNNPNVIYVETDQKRLLLKGEFKPNAPYGIQMVQAALGIQPRNETPSPV